MLHIPRLHCSVLLCPPADILCYILWRFSYTFPLSVLLCHFPQFCTHNQEIFAYLGSHLRVSTCKSRASCATGRDGGGKVSETIREECKGTQIMREVDTQLFWSCRHSSAAGEGCSTGEWTSMRVNACIAGGSIACAFVLCVQVYILHDTALRHIRYFKLTGSLTRSLYTSHPSLSPASSPLRPDPTVR